MSGFVPTNHARSRLRWAWVGALFVLAFVAGLIAARYLTQVPLFRPEAPRPTVQPAAPQARPAAPARPAADAATLDARELALSAQLASLEARTAALSADAGAAGGQATRAEAALVAFAVRRAIDRGLGLGYLEGQLRARFGAIQPEAVELVIRSSRTPVTLENLHLGLEAIAPDLLTGTSRDGWVAGLRRELGGLIMLRKAGTPSRLPADRLARARQLIEAGQVEGARAEVARLPGAEAAATWMAAADRYVATRQALDRLEGAALTGQAAAS